MFNVENACASGSAAVHLAVQSLKAGGTRHRPRAGCGEDECPRQVNRDGDLRGGMGRVARRRTIARLTQMGDGVHRPRVRSRPSRTAASWRSTRRSPAPMQTWGTTQRQIAAVSAKNHSIRCTTPIRSSGSRTPRTGAGRTADHLPADSADVRAALRRRGRCIVCTEEGLRAHRRRPRTAACVSRRASCAASPIAPWTEPELHIGRLAAAQAYELAGLGPDDMDVAEVHDATAMGEIIQAENLGLAGPGEGGPAPSAGDFTIGGRIPVNPSGGLESRATRSVRPGSARSTNS